MSGALSFRGSALATTSELTALPAAVHYTVSHYSSAPLCILHGVAACRSIRSVLSVLLSEMIL